MIFGPSAQKHWNLHCRMPSSILAPLTPMVLYQEHPPCAALAPYLACLWTCQLVPASEPVTHRVLPDNCIDILWQDVAAQGRVAGMMSSVIHVPAPGPVRTMAVRFKPGAGAIARSHGQLRIDALADALGVSRQHLASQFRSRVGLGVKLFARVARFRHASEQIRSARPDRLDWPRLALDLGSRPVAPDPRLSRAVRLHPGIIRQALASIFTIQAQRALASCSFHLEEQT